MAAPIIATNYNLLVELNKEIMGMRIQIIHTNSTILVIAKTPGSYHVYWQKHRLYFMFFSIRQNKTKQ